ncbi:MAG: TonB-dependent receptor [Ferruginibacter sp.]
MQQKILNLFPVFLFILAVNSSKAQDSTNIKSLNGVIVTGQYRPQSLKNSVYRVQVINNERIKLSGAVNLQQVLNTQGGFRFTNDRALGITDVQLNGMSGRNVKILLDGVPVTDRFDERVSLTQIDINTIDRIEIAEGPMSVSYGSDAMAGVINLITKKGSLNKLSISAKAQEETAGKEYHPFSFKGVHTQNLNVGYNKNAWSFNTGGTHIDFSGFGGDEYGRAKSWLPKEQWLANAKLGYTKNAFSIYYRIDAMKEILKDRNRINIDLDVALAQSIDQQFTTHRFMHQLQSSYRFNEKLELSSMAAYTDLTRRTETNYIDFVTNTLKPGTADGQQDLSILKGFSFKNTLQYRISDKVSLQPGLDINYEKATGARITGNPSINEYAFFVSSEYKPTDKISIRPGLRFTKNTQYDAPPAIPSLNTKFILNKNLDLRLAYGYGFRAPVLRELFFLFKDANHDLIGNPDLKAETSNSFNGSLTWTPSHLKAVNVTAALGGFYNVYKNQINLLQTAPPNGTQYSYFNADHIRTYGISLDNRMVSKKFDASLNLNYTGFNRAYDPATVKTDDRDYLWTPEINSNIIYRLTRLKTSLALFYKYIGKKPSFSESATTSAQRTVNVTETDPYNLADLTVTTAVQKFLTLSAGVKNIFDVTQVGSTTIISSNAQHSNAGALSVNYGRSFFLGLALQFDKK